MRHLCTSKKMFPDMCYLIGFIDMGHAVYNFLKSEAIILIFFKETSNWVSGCLSCVVQREKRDPLNLFKLFLISNQKHPFYHPAFQVSHIINLDLYPLWPWLALFLAAILSLLRSIHKG